MPNSFQARNADHRKAVELVTHTFEVYGFECYTIGTEIDNPELYRALTAQSDTTSLMLRFRPDRVHVKRTVGSVLCEIKSEARGSPNFAVEIDSYSAARIWNQMAKHVMLAAVDLEANRSFGAWVDALPTPSKIFVVKRWDFGSQWERMAVEWPDVPKSAIAWRGGSGTPFMLVAKSLLLPLDSFILEQLLTETPTPAKISERRMRTHEIGPAESGLRQRG